MCRKLPKTKEEFTEVSGVGNKKAEKYAGDFCKVIADYVKNNPNAPKAPEEKLSYMEKQLALYKQYAMNKKSK